MVERSLYSGLQLGGIHLVGARHSQGLAQKSSVGSAVPFRGVFYQVDNH
jgi:hypothetical protein